MYVFTWCAKVYIYLEQFKMLVTVLLIFVAHTKIIYGYNFVAPLTQEISDEVIL